MKFFSYDVNNIGFIPIYDKRMRWLTTNIFQKYTTRTRKTVFGKVNKKYWKENTHRSASTERW